MFLNLDFFADFSSFMRQNQNPTFLQFLPSHVKKKKKIHHDSMDILVRVKLTHTEFISDFLAMHPDALKLAHQQLRDREGTDKTKTIHTL